MCIPEEIITYSKNKTFAIITHYSIMHGPKLSQSCVFNVQSYLKISISIFFINLQFNTNLSAICEIYLS